MGYHIIMDSVGDRTEELLAMDNFSVAPLKLIIDEQEFTDDGGIDQRMLLEKIASAKTCPKSACPSPEEYKNLYEKHKGNRIYVIAGTSELTGSYNSAKLAQNLFLEEFPDAQIMVFDSKSGTAGETLLAYKVIEFEKAYNNFERVIKEINQFIKKQETIFVLGDVKFLQQSGRLTGLKSLLVTALNIIPILAADEHGTIVQVGQARGSKKALKKLMDRIIEEIKIGKQEMLVISHCSCLERAEALKDELITIFPTLDVRISNTGGIATLYAGNQGIVVSY